MERAHYLTTDGRLLYKEETNKHHLLWERDAYKSKVERTLRDMPGFVLRMTIGEHKELHANLPPPPKPNHNLMRRLITHSRAQEHEMYHDRFTDTIEFLSHVATTSQSDRNVEDASNLLEHFVAQAVFIDRGKVEYQRGSL